MGGHRHGLEVCEHVPLEKVDQVDVGVGRDDTRGLGLALDREGDEEVDRSVLALSPGIRSVSRKWAACA